MQAIVREAMETGDAPEVVAETVVKAATAAVPRRRYAAGKMARQVSFLRLARVRLSAEAFSYLTLRGIAGVNVYMAPVQNLQLGGRQSKSRYQYTLQSVSGADIGQWANDTATQALIVGSPVNAAMSPMNVRLSAWAT